MTKTKTKLNSFINQFVALLEGDQTQVQAEKAWRSAESALKSSISSMEGDIIEKEDAVATARDYLQKCRVNHGKMITNRHLFIECLIEAKNVLVEAEDDLEEYNNSLEFLKEEYANLKA